MRDLGGAALRSRPEWILVGQSRGAEMADVCTPMGTEYCGANGHHRRLSAGGHL